MTKLAIHGGKSTISKANMGIDNVVNGKPTWPPITEEEIEAVDETLDSGIILGAFAPQVVALQNEWAEYIGTRNCIATCSGTAALHIAAKGVGILPGDEVITSALTFVASAFATN